MADPVKTKTVRVKSDLADMIATICDVARDRGERLSSDTLLDSIIRKEITRRFEAALKQRQEQLNEQLDRLKNRGQK